jgi:hypothetical protein
MTVSLEYARRESRGGTLALPAFICGICSGPIAFGLAVLASLSHWPEIVALGVVLGGALIFACVARMALSKAAPAWNRYLANVAIVAPIVWSIAILLLLIYAGQI